MLAERMNVNLQRALLGVDRCSSCAIQVLDR
jgi:hypothetical protein